MSDAKIIQRPLSDRPHAKNCGGKNQTQQNQKNQCDINQIMKKYASTGLLTHLNESPPQYGDYSKTVNFQEALQIVEESELMFAGLPSDLRRRFENDPQKFLHFCEDKKNHDEMVELGILPKPLSPSGAQVAAPGAPAPGAPPGPPPAEPGTPAPKTDKKSD